MDVLWIVAATTFEWDDRKAGANFRKHRVTFEEAADAFFDPDALRGDSSVDEEVRSFLIGFSGRFNLLLVVHIENGDHVRIISARLATRTEEVTYVKNAAGL